MVFLSNLKEKNRHFVTNKIISYVYKKKVPDIITKTNLILEFCKKKKEKKPNSWIANWFNSILLNGSSKKPKATRDLYH